MLVILASNAMGANRLNLDCRHCQWWARSIWVMIAMRSRPARPGSTVENLLLAKAEEARSRRVIVGSPDSTLRADEIGPAQREGGLS